MDKSSASLVVISLALVIAGSAEAAAKAKVVGSPKPIAVAGDFVVDSHAPTSVIPVAPDLCVIELPATFEFEGDLEGSFSSTFVIEHLGACDQVAPEYFATEGVWVGTVAGKYGSFEYTFEGTIDELGIAEGELVIEPGSGTGKLAKLTGTIALAGNAGVDGSYSGAVTFD